MEQITGYYKSLKVPVSFEEDRIKVGTKTINHNKIYHIREYYITNHSAIFPPTLIVTCAVVTALLSMILLSTISMIILVFGAFLGSVYVFFIHPKLLIRDNPDEYIKIIDIIYTDTHDSIIVKANAKTNIDTIVTPKKTMMQKRVLNRYLSRIRKARNYLIQQFESQTNLTFSALQEKYSSVATARYGLKSTFSVKAVEAVCTAYNNAAGKYVKIGFRLARFSLVIIIVTIIYLAFTDKISYQSFF